MSLQQVVLSFGCCNHLSLLGYAAFEYDYLEGESTSKTFENPFLTVSLK